MIVHRSFTQRFARCALIVIAALSLGCSHAIPRFGIGGRYEEGRAQFYRGRAGDMDVAVVALETVVSQDPTYRDSLTYLGRAYYRKARYQDAHAILQRALVVNKEDEIAWIAFGLTQLRLGQNDKGVETLKGGITLANKVMVDGYRNHLYWDTRGLIRASLRRSAFLLAKGVEEKNGILEATDRLLVQVDEEDNFQNSVKQQNMRQYQGF